jgi:Sec-independent protein translocase protein TatA
MISMGVFLLFLGLIVFGPKKTIELAQELGRLAAKLKHAASQLDVPQAVAQPKPSTPPSE